MERHREARKGTMAAANGSGGGLSRRRQRNSSSTFRDSPEEEGRMEIPETSRLRDRGAKKDRDRDRSNRSRRGRGERLLHGSNRDRDVGDESSEESMDQDAEDEDEDMSVPVRLPPSSPPMPNPAAASSPQQNHQHSNHQLPRKSFLPKAVKWRADEMIGVPVPRKARSASTKRAHEPPVTGGGGGAGGGEHITHQASASPSRLSPASTAQLSPSSSNGSLRKKMKPMNGAKHRPKFPKSTSLCQDEIEIEVAEVLFGMTRQFGSLPQQDGHKLDSRDADVGSGTEAKSIVSSPGSVSPSPVAYASALPSPSSCSNSAPPPATAPKRKKPRHVKLDEESPTNTVVLHNISSLSSPAAKVESETQIKAKNSATPTGLDDVLPSTGGSSNTGDKVEDKEELPPERVDVEKIPPQRIREEKFRFDLMALPGKLSPERDEFNPLDPDTEMAPEVSNDKVEEKTTEIAIVKDEHWIDKSGKKDTDLKKQAVIKQISVLQLDLEKQEEVGFDKMQAPKQQAKDLKAESKQDKSGSASSLHMPLAVGTWPGPFPSYGYMGQVPSLQTVAPINGTAGSSSLLQPPAFLQSHIRPNRCATHYFVAQMISNYQKFARMNCFWTTAAGATPFYAAKPYNQNMVPPPDNFLSGNQMQGGFAMQDTKGTPVAPSYTGSNASQEKILQANSTKIGETAQRKQLILQQLPQSASASNIPASAAINSPVGGSGAGGSATTMNLSFANMPANDAQYVAFLQNNGYPFPIPSQFTGPPFRGTNNAQAMPFFYPSHLLHPQQLQPQQQASQLPHVQQNHQNSSTLSGSSQKHSQQSIQRQNLPPQQARPKECSKGVDANPHSADASVRMGNARGHSNKQPIYQQAQQKQNTKTELLHQTFTIPFASFGGTVNAPAGLDFSMAQNHAILQSLPETFRHGYYQMASAAAAQAIEQKIDHVSEDGKSVAKQSMNPNINDEEDRKSVAASKGAQQSSFSVAKEDGEPAITSVLSNGIIDAPSRPVNPIQSLASTTSYRSAGTVPASTSLTAATIAGNSYQQQQHLIHLPKHQQQHMHLHLQQHLASSRSKPSGLTFPQALIQGGSPLQWPQGKPSAGRGVDPVGASPVPVVKNSFLQLQGRASQQSLPSQAHQTQISFGINGNKQGGQHHSSACSSPSPSSATGAIGSPSNSISKSSSGSPRASTNVKPNLQASAILLPQQANAKHSTSSSTSKSSMSNPNMPPVLGHHPRKLPAPSSITRQQQPSEAQLFFSNPHLQQVQCSAAQYYQTRPAEHSRRTQQQQQHSSIPSTSSMPSLCAPSTLTLAAAPTASDPTKALAVNSLAPAYNLKGLAPTSLLNAAQSASASPRPPMFSYMSLPPFSLKPSAEQKPTAGTENLHACWQPEKR